MSNTCCSHPRPNESIIDAIHRRLDEELGISVRLEKVNEFVYNLDVGGGLKEHEYNHTYVGILEDRSAIKIDDSEVEDFCFLAHNILINRIKSEPSAFTPWFLFLLPKVMEKIQENQLYELS